jgi:gas vesicle protein
MYFEEQKGTFPFVTGLIVGAMLGAGIALLAAPASGKHTRRKMLRRVMTTGSSAGDRVDDWANEFRSALRAGRRRFAAE